MVDKEKVCITVLGMHRSGTSALMGALAAWGVPVGEDLMEGKDENPKGYFENNSVYGVNEEALRILNSAWDDVFPYTNHWWKEPEFMNVRNEIRRILTTVYGAYDLFGLKDPRLNRILPLWLEVFQAQKISPRFVTVVRDPREIAISLWKWRRVSFNKAILLWMQHMVDAEQYSRGYSRTYVSYEDLIRDPVTTIRRIGNDLGVDFGPPDAERIERVGGFVDGGLRHYAGAHDVRLPDWALRYYRILVRCAEGRGDDAGLEAALQTVKTEYLDGRDFFLIPDIKADYARLKPELRVVERYVEKLESEVMAKQARLDLVESEFATLEDTCRRMEADLAATRQEQSSLEDTCRRREADLVAKDAVITRQHREIDRLAAIESSLSWRMLHGAHGLVDRGLFPAHTRRGRWYLRMLGRRRPASGRKVLDETDRPPENVAPHTRLNKKLENMLAGSVKRLTFPETRNPLVTIVIPVWNQWRFTYRCLESILEYTKEVDYEVVVADDASSDETEEMLREVRNVHVVRNPENLGFVGTCNAGAGKARGRYIVFLNNDTTVTPQWLRSLVDLAESDETIGAVGGKLVFEDGRMQEAGSIIWRDGSTFGYGREEDPGKPEFNYVKDVDYCSAALLLVRTSLFNQLGGFDQRYAPAYYEDADLCMGVRSLGYRVVYAPGSTVYHHEFGSGSREKASERCLANRAKFTEKWSAVLTREHVPFSQGCLFARDRREGTRVLVMDDLIPASHLGSGFPRANLLLKYLAEFGSVVTFLPLTDPFPYQPYTDELRNLGVEVICADGAIDVEGLLRDRAGYYDTIIVSRPHNAAKVMTLLRRWFPDAKIIYDAEAVCALRDIKRLEIAGERVSAVVKEAMVGEEIALMKSADVVMAVSEGEQNTIKSLGISHVKVWGFPVSPKRPERSFSERADLLFVGGFLQSPSPNEDAMLYFVDEVFPKVRDRLNCELHIVGTNHLESIRNLAGGGVHVTGYLPDISPFYHASKVFVVPSRYAAGIPLKLLEAMSYGIPAVVTPLIAGQLGLEDGDGVLVGDGPTEFAEKIDALYQDEALWKRLQGRALEFVRATCAPAVLKNELMDILGVPTKINR